MVVVGVRASKFRYVLLVSGWRGGATGTALDLNRSWVQILLGTKLRNNLGLVVHT